MAVETHFSNIQSVIIRELNKANHQILVAVAWFTDDLLYSKLEEAIRQGLKVKLILNDDDINQFSGLNFENLINQGAEIYLYSSNEDTMHQKFCVIDNDIVLAGSYNWTKRAANRNTENLIVFNNDRNTALNFKKQFEELISKSKKFKKKQKFIEDTDLIIKDFVPITPKIVERKIELTEEYVSHDFPDTDLIPFRIANKWGYCDKFRNVKIPLLFDEVRPFFEGLAAIRVNDLWGFIDTEGTKICDCKFNNVNDFKNGYASVQESFRIPARTYRIGGREHLTLGFSNRPSDLENHWGCINRSGEIIIETKYWKVGKYSDGLFNYADYSQGWGFLDNKNNIAIEPKYLNANPFSEGIACVQKRYSRYEKNKPKDDCFFINSKDELLFGRGFRHLTSFYKGYAAVEIYSEGDYYNNCGLIDTQGDFIIKPNYIEIDNRFNQDLIAVSKKIFTGRFEGEYEVKYGFVNLKNNVVIPFKFDCAGYFNNNRAPVRNNEKNKYGYINLEGKLVIDYIFENGYSFNNNLAKVKIGGQFGYIDINGNQYWED